MSNPPPGRSCQHELIALLKQKFGGDPQPGDSLAGLELDSLGMAELSLELERKFEIRIDESILDARTVVELVQYIDRRRAGNP
jgi:acyl carrier protein